LIAGVIPNPQMGEFAAGIGAVCPIQEQTQLIRIGHILRLMHIIAEFVQSRQNCGDGLNKYKTWSPTSTSASSLTSIALRKLAFSSAKCGYLAALEGLSDDPRTYATATIVNRLNAAIMRIKLRRVLVSSGCDK
jgi:hypothetical protein